MDLDAVELVLGAPEARIRPHETRISVDPALLGARLQAGALPVGELGYPRARPRGVGDARVGVDAHLPHDTRPRGGVGAAERDLAHTTLDGVDVLDVRQMLLPDVQVDDVGRHGQLRDVREVRLPAIRELAARFAQDAVDVVDAGTDPKVALRVHGADLEPVVVQRTAVRADEVTRQGLQVMQDDRGLLVPVGVEQHAALLQQDAPKALGGVERETAEIAFHRGFS